MTLHLRNVIGGWCWPAGSNHESGILEQVSRSQQKLFSKTLLKWFESNSRTFAWRNHDSAYETLIAELLLRRTNAKSAERVFKQFLKKYPDLSTFAKADDNTLTDLVETLGLYWRAENIIDLARYFETSGANIPESVNELCLLPGVGPYVSRAVLANTLGLRVVPVDSNVVRVLCRYFGILESDSLRRAKRFQTFADSLLFHYPVREFNYALLDFGAATCRRNLPKCKTCPLNKNCAFANQIEPVKFAEN